MNELTRAISNHSLWWRWIVVRYDQHNASVLNFISLHSRCNYTAIVGISHDLHRKSAPLQRECDPPLCKLHCWPAIAVNNERNPTSINEGERYTRQLSELCKCSVLLIHSHSARSYRPNCEECGKSDDSTKCKVQRYKCNGSTVHYFHFHECCCPFWCKNCWSILRKA